MIGRYRKRSAPHCAGGHVTDFDGRHAPSKSVHHHHHEYDHDRSAERAHDGERNEFATVFHYYPRLLCLVEDIQLRFCSPVPGKKARWDGVAHLQRPRILFSATKPALDKFVGAALA
jgi:hypothetical protein